MSVRTDPKLMVRTILASKILVYEDDTITAIPGHVVVGWYDKQYLAEGKWLVTIGPTISGSIEPNDIGANSWWAEDIVHVDIWVPLKRDTTTAPLNYTHERLRHDLKEAVKGLIQTELVNPESDIKYCRIFGWQELDERESDLLRVQMTVSVEWQE